MFSYILFDLDGTISDPKAGITGCVQYALKSFGIDEPDADKLEPFIGPPLRDSFMKFYGFTPQQAEFAVEKYRERFSVTGKYENTLYPGMAELLRDLQVAGAHLAIASSKPTVFVEDILQYFGIRSCFEIVVGSELNGMRDKKEEVIAEVLRQFAQKGAANPWEVVMIGDRKYDIEGAKAAGTHNIGVSYGYAQPGELQQAGAEIVVRDVEGLRRVLLGYRSGQQPPLSGEPCPAPGEQPGFGPQPAAGRQLSQHQRPQGTFSGNAGRDIGQPAADKKAKQMFKVIGNCLLAMGLYFIVNLVVAGIVLTVSQFISFGLRMHFTEISYHYWINLANAAGTLAGFAACYGIWHKQIRVRPTKPIDGLSVLPAVILAAACAVGMNGILTLLELYKYSPTFQEISAIQFDIPIWLGILSYGILAPLGEEVVFRGVIYGQLRKFGNVPLAVLLSGLIFGLFHGNLVQFVYAAVIGILLAIVYELYGTILAPMIFHGIANLFVYIMLDLTDFGGVFLMPLSCIFFLLISAVSLVLMIKWQKNAK